MLTVRNLDRNWKLNKNVFTTYKICFSQKDFFFVISFNAANITHGRNSTYETVNSCIWWGYTLETTTTKKSLAY